jgi:methyl-accepting chemotaxis protein
VKLVGEVATALEAVTAKVGEIDAVLSEMARSSQEQATGLAEVNIAVNQMDQVTQLNAVMLGKATDAAGRLKSAAAEMAALIGEFRIGEDDDRLQGRTMWQADHHHRSNEVVVPRRPSRRTA